MAPAQSRCSARTGSPDALPHCREEPERTSQIQTHCCCSEGPGTSRLQQPDSFSWCSPTCYILHSGLISPQRAAVWKAKSYIDHKEGPASQGNTMRALIGGSVSAEATAPLLREKHHLKVTPNHDVKASTVARGISSFWC